METGTVAVGVGKVVVVVEAVTAEIGTGLTVAGGTVEGV